MAYRETGDAGGGGSVAQRWLRDLLFADWWLKLVALAVTLGLWFGVTSQRAPVTIRLRGVQLYFLRPDDVEISNQPREEVEVTLQGRSSDLNDLVVRNLIVTVDVSKHKLGERVIRLTPNNISMNLPEGVRIEKIEPGSVALRLERRVERDVKVEGRIEGRPPAGFELRGVSVLPPRVRVRGPESLINALESIPTETISLEGQIESLTLAQTAIDVSDPKIVALVPAVTVRVEIGEERVEKRLSGVPVSVADGTGKSRPPTASVLLRGERSVVEKLHPENIEIVLEQSADGSVAPRLRLPPGTEGRVALVSTSPSNFSINR